MNIDSIKNGIVLDHIRAGRGMQIYNSLGLDQLDCSVAIIKNVKSSKMGKKDILLYTINVCSAFLFHARIPLVSFDYFLSFDSQ